MKRLGLTAAILVALAHSAAMADDLVIKADPDPAAAAQEKIQNAIDIAFGATITSDYISRGVSNSDGKPAFQAYMEASYGMAYAGLWGSSVDFGDDNTAELDLYAGIRPEFGKVTLDIGYARYLYNDDGDCCGEAYVKADYAINDDFSAGGEAFHDFAAQTTYLRAKASYALPQDFSVSGGIGAYTDGSATDWDAGVSRSFGESITADLSYHGRDDGVDITHKIGVSLSFDSSISALSGN